LKGTWDELDIVKQSWCVVIVVCCMF